MTPPQIPPRGGNYFLQTLQPFLPTWGNAISVRGRRLKPVTRVEDIWGYLRLKKKKNQTSSQNCSQGKKPQNTRQVHAKPPRTPSDQGKNFCAREPVPTPRALCPAPAATLVTGEPRRFGVSGPGEGLAAAGQSHVREEGAGSVRMGAEHPHLLSACAFSLSTPCLHLLLHHHLLLSSHPGRLEETLQQNIHMVTAL